MRITDAIEELIIARWAPDDWLTIDDVVNLALDAGITDARSTIQRTMQELRDRRILRLATIAATISDWRLQKKMRRR